MPRILPLPLPLRVLQGHGDKTRRIEPAAVPCLPPSVVLGGGGFPAAHEGPHGGPPAPHPHAHDVNPGGRHATAMPARHSSAATTVPSAPRRGVVVVGGGPGDRGADDLGSATTGTGPVAVGPKGGGDTTARALYRFLSSHASTGPEPALMRR